VFDLSIPESRAATTADRVRLCDRLVERIGAVPGVLHASFASTIPLNGNNILGAPISREDRPQTRNDTSAGFDSVGTDFFQVMQIPLLSGRLLTAQDNRPGAPKVMVINETLARQFFGDSSPLGQPLHFWDAPWEIVGVVGSVRRYSLDVATTPQVYLPLSAFPWYTTFVIRTAGAPALAAASVRRAIADIDPELPAANLHALDEAVSDTLRLRRTMLTLLGAFGAIALLLACVGIYGVVSYSVAQRTREIGIRVALGASSRQVVNLVLSESLRLVGAGVGLGLGASLGAGALIAHQLYEVSGTDPLVLASVSSILLTVGLLASGNPALRATRVSPSIALRAD